MQKAQPPSQQLGGGPSSGEINAWTAGARALHPLKQSIPALEVEGVGIAAVDPRNKAVAVVKHTNDDEKDKLGTGGTTKNNENPSAIQLDTEHWARARAAIEPNAAVSKAIFVQSRRAT